MYGRTRMVLHQDFAGQFPYDQIDARALQSLAVADFVTLPHLSGREVLAALQRLGFVEIHRKGRRRSARCTCRPA